MESTNNTLDATIEFTYLCPNRPTPIRVRHALNDGTDVTHVDADWGEVEIDILCTECDKYHTIEVL